MSRILTATATICCLTIVIPGLCMFAPASTACAVVQDANSQTASQDAKESQPTKKKTTEEEVELNEKEKAFKKLMTKAKLRGKFTINGQDADKLASEEYTILRVNKTPEKDLWVFMARAKYGDKDYTVPLLLNVKWADDTPMITLTDLKILGEGPFSARVLFHQNMYAGTWSHGEVGGHLFGKIESGAENERGKDAKKSE